MSSLRGRLGWGLGGALALLQILLACLLFSFVRFVLYAEFDRSLEEKARLFAAGTETLADGNLEFEVVEARMPEFWPGPGASHAQLWRDSGEVVFRSPSLNGKDLLPAPPGVTLQFGDVPITGGRPERMVTFEFRPHPDLDSVPPINVSTIKPLRLAYAVSRGSLERSVTRIFAGVLFAALLLSACVVLGIRLAIEVGLRPLGRIAAEASAMMPQELSQRFSLPGLPNELIPIAQRLNGLLDRLEGAFHRERRFTADAAHELRTPVAELRTLAEVGLMEMAGSDSASRAYLEDVLAIARQLERLITGLLALARLEQARLDEEGRAIDLVARMAQSLQKQGLQSLRPDIQLDLELPASAIVVAREELIGILLDNVIANLTAHTAPDGHATIALEREGETWLLRAVNDASGLTEDDLSHCIEAFWRKDAARGGEHSGLGLALVSESARLLCARLSIKLVNASQFCIEVHLRAHESSVVPQQPVA